jgi:tRNA-Thr(GGU) m(6)t(6)A37 methyltransferase TsaA
MITENLFHPIGYISSDKKFRYETPRQGVLAVESISEITLLPHHNFEQAVEELDGFDRIWIIYQFHLNTNWKPKVTPPRHTRKKIGVFATRAPYRPNPIGISCVKLLKVEGLKIFITESDILDGSPVLDIKPYLPYSDSFPDVKTGWVKSGIENKFEIECNELATTKMKWLKQQAGINLRSFARLQLEFNPTDDSRKRIARREKDFILSYRTWRILYSVDPKTRSVLIADVYSGYSNTELIDKHNDVYEDKEVHRLFVQNF